LEEERAKDLSTMFDVEISPKQIILSHTPMRSLVSKYGDSKVLIVGSRKSPEVAKHYGFKKSIGISGFCFKSEE
jgi:ribonucleotide monophosphatase NagD (HAD superfamily)